MTTGKGARTPVPPTDAQPPGARIRVLRKEEDIADVPNLNDEERALAHKIVEHWYEQTDAPITCTMGMWLNDPKYEQEYHQEWHLKIIKLCAEQPDPSQANYVRPGTITNLLFLSVAKHFHWTWGIASLAAVAPHVEGSNAEQPYMLDFPESVVWNDEQRLMLIFAKAVMTVSVTDELMAQALKMWGAKLTIRYIGLIGSLTTQAFSMNAFNVVGRWNDAPPTEVEYGRRIGETDKIIRSNQLR